MILDATNKKLQILLSGAVTTNQLPFQCEWVDVTTSASTPGTNGGTSNDTTPVDLVPVPGASTQRIVNAINIYNDDTVGATVTVRFNDGGTLRTLKQTDLDSGDTLMWSKEDGWESVDSSGRLKTVSGTTGSVPLGAIVIWSGSIASIPADYHLCDGTSGTVDLRDKFVVGAKQDDAGIAKTNLTGALAQSGGTTAHIHSAHANLTHTGLTIGDHTGLTHGLSIANHPDLTHVAINNHSVASQAITVVGLTHADHSQASQAVSNPSGIGSGISAVGTATSVAGTAATASISNMGTLTLSESATGTARSFATVAGTPNVATHTVNVPSNTVNVPSGTVAVPANTGSFPANTLTHASHPTHTGSSPALTLTHAAPNTHVGTDYGVHTFTAPADHGAAGTVTHSYSQPNDHVISAHDTVANVIPFYALAFIQRVA